tara:strand:- start:399 stop:545 length:147 start_codon:yes stop_codon:yes gene_type:complete
MGYSTDWLKYLSPFFGILFCPVTILFIWAIWSGPTINSSPEVIEDIKP